MAKTKKKVVAPKQSITQVEIMREMKLHKKLRGYTLDDIEDVISVYKETLKKQLKKGKKIIIRDFITLDPVEVPEKKDWVSPIDGKKRTIPARTRVCVRVGRGLKEYVQK